MSVADALAAPSLEMAAVHPALSVATGAASGAIDWSVNRLVLTRTAIIVVWAWSVGRFGFSLLWVTAVSLLLVFSIVRQRKRAQLFHTLKFQKASSRSQRHGGEQETPSQPLMPLCYCGRVCLLCAGDARPRGSAALAASGASVDLFP